MYIDLHVFTVIEYLVCSGILFQMLHYVTVGIGWDNMTSLLVGLM